MLVYVCPFRGSEQHSSSGSIDYLLVWFPLPTVTVLSHNGHMQTTVTLSLSPQVQRFGTPVQPAASDESQFVSLKFT